MDRYERACIQMECQQLLNRITQLLDRGCWRELADCYTEDAVLFRPSDPDKAVEGRQAIYEAFCTRPPRTSCHIVANSVFDILDSDQVECISRVWLVAGDASDSFPVSAGSELMVGSFVDLFVRINGAWFIKSRKGTMELKYAYR